MKIQIKLNVLKTVFNIKIQIKVIVFITVFYLKIWTKYKYLKYSISYENQN